MNRFTAFVYPLLGCVLIIVGAAWIYHPLGPITAGSLLITLAVLGKNNKPK